MALLPKSPFDSEPKAKFKTELRDLAKAHVDSFNYILRGGLTKAIKDIFPFEFSLVNGERIKLRIVEGYITSPRVPPTPHYVRDPNVYPAECRQRKITYKGQLHLKIAWSKNGKDEKIFERCCGNPPMMLMTDCCTLSKLSPTELIKHGEEEHEFGGYFIVNGVEKLIRMLIAPRRNYPLALVRSQWKQKGKFFSEFGVTARCIRDGHTTSDMILHYLSNGTCKLMFSYNKELFYVPLILVLKALCNETDYYIYTQLTNGIDDSFYKGCIKNMLRDAQDDGLLNQKMVCNYIGKIFRVKLFLPPWYTNEQVTHMLLHQCVCIHLNSNRSKFDFLVLMARKLFALTLNKCAPDNPDNPMNQEVLLGGQLYLMFLKERLTMMLYFMRQTIEKKMKTSKRHISLEQNDLTYAASRLGDICKPLEVLLSTGNLTTKFGLGMNQTNGISVVLDKINYLRFISHFHSVHRGGQFTNARSTAVRKLRPEAWGFICPVHTPDGTPCGLLNHLSIYCRIVPVLLPPKNMKQLLLGYGMTDLREPPTAPHDKCYIVFLDGEVLGLIAQDRAEKFCKILRELKAKNLKNISPYLEIVLVPDLKKQSLYPGVYLFSTPSRMMRSVKNLATQTIELIGTFEQVYLDICVVPEEFYPNVTTHMEIKQTSILSLMANLVPFSNYNQSPRNMYQCQMAKQTMGTPHHAIMKKPDCKVFRLQTPQSPLVRPALYDEYELDSYCSGTNAIVAVISYTGYDMEDAMVINKASIERGFAHGTVYKSDFIDLPEVEKSSEGQFTFALRSDDKRIRQKIDVDGLPHVGVHLTAGDPYYSYVNLNTNVVRVIEYKSQENAVVDCVRVLGEETSSDVHQRAYITLRVTRNPDIGDKFANRHGQKGICSVRYRSEDLPFTDSGMVPDIIFNPHGFPSRMTIGMIIESMAGKSAATHGFNHDATPFTFSENDTAIDYMGTLLQKAGYNYYGSERMYSGIDGEELEADIFFGVIYYQRLRHMVADKFQVRSMGVVDQMTHQPVKGRKRQGGIRFGEMERDSLIAHGTSNLLKDRLFNCSDASLEYVCTKCKSMLSPILKVQGMLKSELPEMSCATCNSRKNIEIIAIPYVFKYLTCELAAVNIKVELEPKSIY